MTRSRSSHRLYDPFQVWERLVGIYEPVSTLDAVFYSFCVYCAREDLATEFLIHKISVILTMSRLGLGLELLALRCWGLRNSWSTIIASRSCGPEGAKRKSMEPWEPHFIAISSPLMRNQREDKIVVWTCAKTESKLFSVPRLGIIHFSCTCLIKGLYLIVEPSLVRLWINPEFWVVYYYLIFADYLQ